jgi:hypothetical protein
VTILFSKIVPAGISMLPPVLAIIMTDPKVKITRQFRFNEQNYDISQKLAIPLKQTPFPNLMSPLKVKRSNSKISGMLAK